MHLVPWRNRQPRSSGPLDGGRRQDSSLADQGDLLLPGDHSLASLAFITPKHKLLQMWNYYIRQYRCGGWFCRAENITQDKHRDVQKPAHITTQWFSSLSDVLFGSMMMMMKMSTDMREIQKHFYETHLKVIVKHVHIRIKTVHIHPPFQLPVYANPSISD